MTKIFVFPLQHQKDCSRGGRRQNVYFFKDKNDHLMVACKWLVFFHTLNTSSLSLIFILSRSIFSIFSSLYPFLFFLSLSLSLLLSLLSPFPSFSTFILSQSSTSSSRSPTLSLSFPHPPSLVLFLSYYVLCHSLSLMYVAVSFLVENPLRVQQSRDRSRRDTPDKKN